MIVGGMANNIIKYMGNNIGKSLQEENSDTIIKEIISLSETENCKIIYPQDVVVGKNLNDSPLIKELNEISKDVDFSELCITSSAEVSYLESSETNVQTTKAEGSKCQVCWKITKDACSRKTCPQQTEWYLNF